MISSKFSSNISLSGMLFKNVEIYQQTHVYKLTHHKSLPCDVCDTAMNSVPELHFPRQGRRRTHVDPGGQTELEAAGAGLERELALATAARPCTPSRPWLPP